MTQTLSEKLLAIFTHQPSHALIANLHSQIITYRVQKSAVITSVNDEVTANCYVASPYTLMIAFAREELYKLESPWLRFIAKLLIGSLQGVLRLGQIDRLQTLNNQLLSTNVFSAQFNDESFLRDLIEQALQRYPNHCLAIRCVNQRHYAPLFRHLKQQGFIFAVTRQVYIFNDFKYVQGFKNYQRDKKLLSCTRYIFQALDLTDPSQFKQAEALYNQLYLDKYSQHNVQFTALYLQQLAASGALHLRLLYDTHTNKAVAVVGLIGENGVITAPVVGYDFAYPQNAALYRRVIAYAMDYAYRHSYQLNLSSGASQFKMHRGAQAELEYMMVYSRHLPWYRRALWVLLAKISTAFYTRLLKRYQL